MSVNDDDGDGDGIPDFADGFNRDGVTGNADDAVVGEKFVPMLLSLHKPIDVANALVRFSYSASDPAGIVTANGALVAGAGHLRVWKKDGSAARDAASVSAGGDYAAHLCRRRPRRSASPRPPTRQEDPSCSSMRIWLSLRAPRPTTASARSGVRSKGRAGAVISARRDLRWGRRATPVPTATRPVLLCFDPCASRASPPRRPRGRVRLHPPAAHAELPAAVAVGVDDQFRDAVEPSRRRRSSRGDRQP